MPRFARPSSRVTFKVLMMAAALLPAVTSTAQAAGPAILQPGTAPQIELSVDAQQSAQNDLGRATVYVEMQDANPADLSRRVNNAIGAALGIATKFSGVKTRTGDVSSIPVYGKNNRIDTWRMRAEILLESRDIGALSDLLGRLQGYVAVGDIQLTAAPETRKRAEDDALREALAAFKARAKLIADQLGQPYRIVSLNIATGGRPPIMARSMRVMSAAEASPVAAIAAGESTVTVVVSGKIELGP